MPANPLTAAGVFGVPTGICLVFLMRNNNAYFVTLLFRLFIKSSLKVHSWTELLPELNSHAIFRANAV